MPHNENAYTQIISSVSTVAISALALLLPLFFLFNTTEFFSFPKQILLGIGTIILLILYCLKNIAEKKVLFVKNPLNLPILVFSLAVLISSYISPSSIIAIPQAISLVMLAILFFVIVNLVSTKQNLRIIIFSLILGSILGSLISIFASFGIYLLPFDQSRNEFFNTLGSPIQMIGFTIPLLILALTSFSLKYRKVGKEAIMNLPVALYGISFLIFSITIGLLIYKIASASTPPIILPFDHGFQLALAAISQNEQRLLPSFLFGSGYATFSTVFTKFHLASFNTLSSWNLVFSFSSSYVLELIATTGILGFLGYVFMIIKFLKPHGASYAKPLFLATASIFALSFLLPFSYPLVALLFILLALHVSNLKLANRTKHVDEVALSLETKGRILEFNETNSIRRGLALPFVILLASIGFIIYSLFFLISREGFGQKGLYHYVLSDIIFAQSLQPEAISSGQETYELQIEAIQTYPYRADFYRVFAQINIALASNLVSSQADAPTVSEEVQQTIVQQLQQAINASRQSVIFAPESSLNWRSLGQVYRNLIGVGQDAEQFAIASYNQAVSLEPNNPALRVELGGIYYQLKEFDLAQNQFQAAINLKQDYANAYYNLAHTLEEKGQLEGALQQYQIVKQLVANDNEALAIIDGEISELQERIGTEQEAEIDSDLEPTDETELGIEQPQQQFPERDPREEIPAPPTN